MKTKLIEFRGSVVGVVVWDCLLLAVQEFGPSVEVPTAALEQAEGSGAVFLSVFDDERGQWFVALVAHARRVGGLAKGLVTIPARCWGACRAEARAIAMTEAEQEGAR